MEKWEENKKKWCLFVLFLIGLFLIFRYILPLFAPFILAFLVIAPMEPMLERISKKIHLGKGILAGIAVIILMVMIAVISWYGGTFLMRLFSRFMEHSGQIEEQLNHFIGQLSETVEIQFGLDGSDMEAWMENQIDQSLQAIQVDIFPKIMNQSFLYLKNVGIVLTFLVIWWIAAILLAKDFNRIRARFAKNYYVRYIRNELKKLGCFVRTFLVAQLIIMGGISVLSFIGFLISDFSLGNAVGLGVLTGFLDVLPFLGTGIVLLPIALWQLVMGHVKGFLILLLTFFVTLAFRELVEPRLVGEKMGLWPIAFLMSVYVGIQVFGILGIILGPIYLIIAADWYYNAEIST